MPEIGVSKMPEIGVGYVLRWRKLLIEYQVKGIQVPTSYPDIYHADLTPPGPEPSNLTLDVLINRRQGPPSTLISRDFIHLNRGFPPEWPQQNGDNQVPSWPEKYNPRLDSVVNIKWG